MMKSKVCKMANSYIREGINRSAAFVRAWATIKIEKIDDELFSLNMIDRQSAAEKETVRKLRADRAALVAKSGIETKSETVKAAPVEQKIETPYLTADEKTSIQNKMFGMWADYRNFNMDEYKALEAQLYVTVLHQVAA